MSLKETLKIDLQMLGVSQAIQNINKIKEKTVALQNAATNIKFKVASQYTSNGSSPINNYKVQSKKTLEYLVSDGKKSVTSLKSIVDEAEYEVTRLNKLSPKNQVDKSLQKLATARLKYNSEKVNISGAVQSLSQKDKLKYYNSNINSDSNYIQHSQSELEPYFKNYGYKDIFNKYKSLKDELNSVSNGPATQLNWDKKTQLSDQIKSYRSKNPILEKFDYQDDIKTYYQSIRKNQAKINQIYSKSASDHAKVEKTAYAGINRLVEESVNFTDKSEKKKTKDVEQEANNRYKDEVAAAHKAYEYFQTGFSLHMLNIYSLPIILAIKSIGEEALKTFSEFDKKYKSYTVKSEEYASVLSKQDFYGLSKDTTYGLVNATDVGERFAASGIDVANSQQALTSTLQTATLADMDYKEATDGVIETLQAMHLQTDQTTQVTDAMINSADASSAELSDLVTWFGYAASAAYRMNMNVQDLSKYLGVLASTGTPDAGAAMRQMLIQLSKTAVQQKIKVKYSFVSDDDFKDANKLIAKLRNYVQNSPDKKAASTEVLSTIEGSANAQQALNNLITAEPELWNRISSAVDKTGTTQDRYNKSTDNAADSLAKIATNIEILKAQFGSFFVIIAYVLEKITTVVVTLTTSMPDALKFIIGGVMAIIGTFIVLASVAIAVIGAMAILQGTLIKLQTTDLNLTLSTANLIDTLQALWIEITKITINSNSLSESLNTVALSTKNVNSSMLLGTSAISGWQGAITAISAGVLGYSVSSMAMQKQMYAEASAVSLLTASYLALQTARSIPGPLGIVAAAGVFTGYEALMYSKLEDAKREDRNRQLSRSSSAATVQKNYNVNVANATWASDGQMFEDFADQVQGQSLDADTEEDNSSE